jgi:hypothetical protein
MGLFRCVALRLVSRKRTSPVKRAPTIELSADDIELDPPNADSEFADERSTVRVSQRTPCVVRTLRSIEPRFPKATRQRAAVASGAWENEPTRPQVVAPWLVEACRGR